jgi:hypothetical protein
MSFLRFADCGEFPLYLIYEGGVESARLSAKGEVLGELSREAKRHNLVLNA